MNSYTPFLKALVISVIGFSITPSQSTAADAPKPADQKATPAAVPAKKSLGNRAVVIQPKEAAGSNAKEKHPKRPDAPGRPVQTKEVGELVNAFNEARSKFLRDQVVLRANLKAAAVEDRAAIREQIRESLQEWIDEQRRRIRDLREQREDMKGRLELNELLNESTGG